MTEQDKQNKPFEDIGEYLQLRYEIEKLKLVEKVAISTSSGVTGIIVILLFLIGLVFLSVAGAFWLTQYYRSPVVGFSIIASAYLIIGTILLLFPNSLVGNRIKNLMIKKLLH